MAVKTLITGLSAEQLVKGEIYQTAPRTITESDLVNFVNAAWFTEEIFTNTATPTGIALHGRVIPAALVYSYAEGLNMPYLNQVGLAFLGADIAVKNPTYVGDTIHVEFRVLESRLTSKPEKSLVKTENIVYNQDGLIVMIYTPLRLLKTSHSGINS
jgi:acyl dehydratase